MRNAPRFFSRSLTGGQSRVYRTATAVFVAIFLALVWPVYPIFAGIRPMFLGIPLSLFYVVALVGLSFFTVLTLYLWEERGREESDEVER
jgi:hypothetical protein